MEVTATVLTCCSQFSFKNVFFFPKNISRVGTYSTFERAHSSHLCIFMFSCEQRHFKKQTQLKNTVVFSKTAESVA